MDIFFYRYGSICEPDVIDSLQHLGLNVIEEHSEMYKKTMMPAECVTLVSKKLLNHNYTFVFTINYFPWMSDVCDIAGITYISLIVDSPVLELYSDSLCKKCNRIFLFDKMLYNEFASRNPGHVFHVPLATNIRRDDQVIQDYAKQQQAISNHTVPSPAAQRHDHFNTTIAPIAPQRSKYAADIAFIGSTYQEKCPFNRAKLPEFEKGYVDGLIEAQLKVYGYNFIEETLNDTFVETFRKCTPGCYQFPSSYDANYKAVVAQLYISVKVAEQERLRALKMLSDSFDVDIYTGSDTSSMPHIHNKGFARSLDEMPLIFNQSKINLNITAKSIRSGLSLRIFDVLGCGGFLITNYQAEIPEFFEIGRDLVVYESFDDLKEKCAYYLKHDDERKAIAAHGYETVKRLYTYDNLVLRMIDLSFPKTEN